MSAWPAVRSAVDRLVAGVLLLVAAPVIALIAALKRLEDGGRAFVRIPRAGRHGAPFAIVKIRSMRAAGPDGLASGASLAAGEDPRITRLGRVLRRWRIDELPQLAQVVAGSMALVGPRPEAVDYVVAGDESWDVVLRARPGIAGVSQLLFEQIEASLPVEGVEFLYRTQVLPLKLRVDRWYVEHASPLTDALVVAALVDRFVLRREPVRLVRYAARRIPGFEADYLALAQAVGVRP